MPSHRADTPADAPTALRTRPSAHPTHPPLQRRRDLRTRGPVAGHAAPAQPRQGHVDDLGGLHSPAGPAFPVQRPVAGSRVAAAWAAARPTEERVAAAPESTAAKPLADPAATTCSLDVEAVGALALPRPALPRRPLARHRCRPRRPHDPGRRPRCRRRFGSRRRRRRHDGRRATAGAGAAPAASAREGTRAGADHAARRKGGRGAGVAARDRHAPAGRHRRRTRPRHDRSASRRGARSGPGGPAVDRHRARGGCCGSDAPAAGRAGGDPHVDRHVDRPGRPRCCRRRRR